MRLAAFAAVALFLPFGLPAQQRADSTRSDSGLSAHVRPIWDEQEEYRTGARFSDAVGIRAERVGLRVSPAAGALGLTGRLRLRGPQTIFDEHLPLIILDDMRLDVATGFLGGTARLEDINPDDLESVEVLAPAQAVRYGPDAANGVIVVRTREGVRSAPHWRGYIDVGVRMPVDALPPQWGGFDASHPDTSFRNGGCTLMPAVTGQCTQDSIGVLASRLSPQLQTALRRQFGLSVTGGWGRHTYYVGGELDGDGSPFSLSNDEINRLESLGQSVTGAVRHPQHVSNGNVIANLQLRPLSTVRVNLHGLHVGQDIRVPTIADQSAGSFGFYALETGLLAPGDAFQVQSASNVRRWLGGVSVEWRPVLALSFTGSASHDGVRRTRAVTGGFGSLTDSVALFSENLGLAGEYDWGPRQVALRSHVAIEASRADRDSTECASSTADCTGGLLQRSEQAYHQRFWSLVVEQRAMVIDRLELAAVVRRDHFKEQDRTETHPGFHAAWLATPVNIHVDVGWTGRRPFLFPRPERTTELSAGVGIRPPSDRYTAGATVYDMRSSIYAYTTGIPSGPPVPLATGKISNRGVELFASVRVVDRENTTFTVDASAWGNRNRLRSLSVPAVLVVPSTSQQRFIPGYPVGGYWAYRPAVFADANGDGIIEPSEATFPNELIWAGTAYPTQGATLAPQFGFRSIRAGMSLDYQAGHSVFNRSAWLACVDGHCSGAVDPHAPLADQADALLSRFGATTAYFEDGDFLAWRELWVTVDVSPRVTRALHLRSASVTLAGRNLHTWTGFSGISPEPYAVETPFGNGESLSEPAMPALQQWSLRVRVSY